MRRILAAVALGFTATFPLAGCAQTAALDLSAYEAVIDVRTPEEWVQGRLDTAVRIGLADPDFATQLATLDPEDDYFLYCRSGNRASQAIEIMRDLGFTGEIVNGGSLGNAASLTGLPVVTD
jgi:rhodanese-related sulfurtransferase